MAALGVDAILAVKGTDRAARSYAFLYAAFKRSEITNSPVRDAVDCLVPFIIPYLNQNIGQQIDLTKLQAFLRESFDFDIPLYVLDQLLPTLERLGHLSYDRRVRIYVAIGGKDDFKVAKEEIETDFERIASRLKKYANDLGVDIPPPSGSWDAALIVFLKSKVSEEQVKFATVKGVLMNPRAVETSVVASFIRDLHVKDPGTFDAILRVFMGTLIEEFISTVTDIGSTDAFRNLVAFYDTSVLLRLLGCSGALLRVATDELTRYLQDLGIQLSFLSGNEAEVHGVLSAIVTAKDVGGEVFGETAGAIANGEISMADLRLMQTSVVEQLARKGIFPADKLEGEVQKNSVYQIDENGFAEFLAGVAAQAQRSYNQQNLRNDASYLGAVMRLRRGIKTRDLSESKAVFVTTNKLFATSARRYLIKQKQLRGIDCPPVLQVGQIATIAWLMREHKIDPAKAGRELLSNCYAAIKPDSEWFQNFRTAIEKIVGNLDAYAAIPENNIRLQAARRIAQDQTFGNANLVRTLNTAELLSAADRVAESEKAKIRKEEILKAEAGAQAAKVAGRQEVLSERKSTDEARARAIAAKLRKYAVALGIILFVVAAALYDQSAIFSGQSYLVASVQIAFLVPLVLSTMDLFGISAVKSVFNAAEAWMFRRIFKTLSGNEWEL